MDLRALIRCAISLGFGWNFSRDDYMGSLRWITLYRSDIPYPLVRYQFRESAEGLDQLYQFLQFCQQSQQAYWPIQ